MCWCRPGGHVSTCTRVTISHACGSLTGSSENAHTVFLSGAWYRDDLHWRYRSASPPTQA